MVVELTEAGYLVLPAPVARRCFGDAPVAQVAVRDSELHAMALGPGAVGGLILKQRNRAGDRAVLVVEHLRDTEWVPGRREAVWDESGRALRVPLVPTSHPGERDGWGPDGESAPHRDPAGAR